MDEIFWKDYFKSLGEAIDRLAEIIRHPEVDTNDFMRDAAIQRFEFVIELFWKVLRKALIYEKIAANTPREVISMAYQYNLISDEEMWLKMLTDRNNTSHTYKLEDAKIVYENIKLYLPVFESTYASIKNHYKL